MKAGFDIVYTARVKTRSAAGPREMKVRERLNVEVAEIAAEDAPMAAEWDTPGGAGHTRFHEGHHHRPVLDYEFGLTDARMILDSLVSSDRMCRDSIWEGFTGGFFDLPAEWDGSIPADDRKIEWISPEDRDKAHRLVARWSVHAVAIGGQMFIRCPEPSYCADRAGVRVQTAQKERGRRLVEPLLPFFTRNAWFQFETFGANDPLAAERAVAERHGIHGEAPELRVHLPEAFVSEWERLAVVEACLNMMDEIDQAKTSQMHPRLLTALHPLASTLWKRMPDEIDGELAAETLEALWRAAADVNPGLLSEGLMTKVPLVLDRWHARSIEIELGGPQP
jgi:hypothetical protein